MKDDANQTNRRQFVRTVGLGGVAVFAGCIGTVEPDIEPPALGDNELGPVQTVDVGRIAADPTDIPGPIDRSESHELE